MRSGTLVGLGFFLGKQYPPSPTYSPRAVPSARKRELQLPACLGARLPELARRRLDEVRTTTPSTPRAHPRAQVSRCGRRP